CVAVDPANSSIIYVGTPAGGLWRTTVGGNAWTSLTDGLSSLGVSGVVIDPTSPASNRTLYILTGDGDAGDTYSTGVLRSADNGATWQSTGLSWHVTNYIRGYKLIMHPTNSQILMAATTNGMYRTTDGGINWSRVIDNYMFDIEFKPNDPNTVYAVSHGTFYRSSDAGATWTIITSGTPTSDRLAIAVSPANANYIYILQGTAGFGTFGGVYRSEDSGLNFSLRSNSPNILGYASDGSDGSSQAWYDLAIAVNPTNAEEVHTGGISCWKSTNGGANWVYTSIWYEPGAGVGNYTHADIHALEFFGNTLYCGSDGGVSKSSNAAEDWLTIWNGLQISQPYKFHVDGLDPDKLVAGLQDNGSNKLDNGTFYHVFGADGMDCAIDQTNTNTFYFSYQGGNFFRTNDNGNSITYINPSGQSGNWVTPCQLDPNAPSTLYLGFVDLWKSIDQGTSWTNISNGNIGFYSANMFQVAPSNSNVIYVAKYNELYKTVDGGASWSLAFNNIGDISGIAIHPTNPDQVWVSFGNYYDHTKVYKTTDAGASWTNISGSLPNIPANCLAYDVSGLYLGTDVGIYVLEEGANDWSPFNANFPNVIVKDMEVKHGYLYAGTYGRGFWRSTLAAGGCVSNLNFSGTHTGTLNFEASATITSSAQIASGSTIKYKAGSSIQLNPGFIAVASSGSTFKATIGPCGAALRKEAAMLTGLYTGPMEGVAFTESLKDDEQLHSSHILVFPNPAKAMATIEYHVEQDTEVSIYVSDATGRKVKELISQAAHAVGDYTTTLNVASLQKGLYICTIIQGNIVKSAKIEVE
ncbi:MAG TPA: T9SS type A sorting domain-containing protein, partial [Cytophagales bacterium]|nr:T9SS type A sorting domain-containing protein [Cytophagales bacterium]